MDITPDNADILLNEYFNDLVIRGIIDENRREEVLYAVKHTD